MHNSSTNTTYSIAHEKDTKLTLYVQNAVDILIHAHQNAVPKPQPDFHVICSAFETQLPKLQNVCDRKKATHYQNRPLRSFLHVFTTHKTQTDADTFNEVLTKFIENHETPDYITYRDNNNINTQHVVIKVSQYLDKNQYAIVLNYLLQELNIQPNKTNLAKMQSVTNPVEYPAYKDLNTAAYTAYSQQQQSMHIDSSVIGTNIPQNTQTLTYSVDKLEKALDTFFHQMQYDMTDAQVRTKFFTSLATTIVDGIIPESIAEAMLQKLVTALNGDDTTYQAMRDEYQFVYDTCRTDASIRLKATPIGTYLTLYSTDEPVTNIAEQLISHLDENFVPSHKVELATAINMIALVYPPHIIKQAGNDRDNVVLFNPLTGVWSHDEDIVYSLLTALRPTTTYAQLDTAMRTFAAQARNANRYIKPYSGSRYLLFKNCCVDVEDYTIYDVESTFVRELYFTERSRLHINFVYKPELPVIKDGRIAGGDWNPRDFIYAYGDNDPEKVKYFLFGLSLGLFGGHNFGVHFDIQGESRWGKSTLSEIFNMLYDNKIMIISFTALNGRFPFTSYPLNTSVIWIKECNIGTDPLNDEHGTVIYDGLADNQVRFEVKRGADIVLNNPPQVYIDGTQLIQAKEINTGPAGRTLAYKLPQMTQSLRDQAYSVNIIEALHSEDIMQWLVYEMIEAYREMIPSHRRNDLKMNLAIKSDLELLPEFAREWRTEFSTESSDLNTWFIEEIDPFISDDEQKPTLMHMRILYELYTHHYMRNNPADKYLNKIKDFTAFDRQMQQVMQSNNWRITPQGTYANARSKVLRKKVSNPRMLNFDFAEYQLSYKIPDSLVNADEAEKHNLKGVFKSQIAGWFTITPREASMTTMQPTNQTPPTP